MPSITTRDMAATPTAVFDVLEDGWLFAVWVVGACRIRKVDAGWPAVGSVLHHSVGSWPALINDTTSVVDLTPGRMLRLRGRAWPAGEADILITIQPWAGGSRVSIIEDAIQGPGVLIPPPVRHALLRWRNRETLRRLDLLAAGRTPVHTVARHSQPTEESS